MGYKQMEPNMTFAEVSLSEAMKRNLSLKRLEKINRIIDWDKVDKVFQTHYSVGSSKEGADAYPPLMLLKGLLLQKWYKIDSDPDLENQINEGVAVDARLVESASRPISKEQIKQEQDKRQAPEGSLDKNGKPVKFMRDIESDWTVKNNKPHYGIKEHASVDTKHGFVLATELSPASVNDSIYLPYCIAASCHTREPIKKVYADKGYHGKPNREFLSMNNIQDGIMRKDSKTTKLTDNEKQRNNAISKKRYIVEQYFGLTHLHNGAYRARFTQMIKNKIDAMCKQMAFNLFRGVRVFGTA